MALTLAVDRAAWLASVQASWDAYTDLVPVVKGNGYGFGREVLARVAVDLGATELAVGSVHEISSVPAGTGTVVLTPAAPGDLPPSGSAVLTVGRLEHVEWLRAAGWQGSVVVKLASPMGRFGAEPAALEALLRAVADTGLQLHAFGVHLPLVDAPGRSVAAVRAWLPRLPPSSTVHVSHVESVELRELAALRPDLRIRPRVGTALWHADRQCLHLRADVLERRAVAAGDRLGYRLVEATRPGHVVVVSGGTAHGVQPLPPDGRSPFHFARTRLTLVEPPYMHTSMLFVPEGAAVPELGDQVDVQRPLTQTWVDRITGLEAGS